MRERIHYLIFLKIKKIGYNDFKKVIELKEVNKMFNSKKQFAHVYDINDFESLTVNVTGTDVVLRQGEHPTVIYYGEKKDRDYLKITQSDKILEIRDKRGISKLKHSLVFKFMIGRCRLEITLPSTDLKKVMMIVNNADVAVSNATFPLLHLITAGGSITMACCHFDNLNIDTKTSNVVMKNIHITDFALNNGTGNVLFDHCDFNGSVKAAIDEGRLKMREVTFKNALINLGSGDVYVSGFKTNGDFNLSTDVGDLTLRGIEAPAITIAAVRGNDLENPDVVSDVPQHQKGTVGATFITSAGHLDVHKDIEIDH